jgi:transcriptional regulator with XRE-family HTH domain
LDGYVGGVVTYGERLRELRAERRLSLRQVEERGGPNKDTMSLIERDVHRPHPQTLGRIADALDISVPDLRAELESASLPLAQAPPEEERSSKTVTGGAHLSGTGKLTATGKIMQAVDEYHEGEISREELEERIEELVPA